MKRCSICKKSKQKTEFNKNSGRKDGLQSHCRPCSKERFKAYYNSNKEKHYKDVKKNQERYKNRNREYVYQYLMKHPCVDCGETNPLRLEFDHLRDKEYAVSKMVDMGLGLNRVGLVEGQEVFAL